MDALEFLMTKKRMCKVGCKKCPVSYTNNGKHIECTHFMETYPEKFVELVEYWNTENPKITRADKLKELFPCVDLIYGAPRLCPKILEGGTSERFNCGEENCFECEGKYWRGEYVQK